MLLTTTFGLFLTMCLKPSDASEIRRKFSKLATVPDQEIFKVDSPDLPRCVHFCVSNKDCNKMMYQDSESQYRGYGFGSNQTTEPLNEGQVVMQIKGIKGDFKDCGDIMKAGATQSGVYDININNQTRQVNCDMDTDGGGWTVLLRHNDGSVSFVRDWEAYKQGFGDLEGEFWAGNELMHMMTNATSYSLRVDLTPFTGDSKYAIYQNFSVAAENDKFRLLVLGNSGTAGNKLGGHNGMMFSTKHIDNDDHSSVHCALYYGAPWWFSDCYTSFLTGEYGEYPAVAAQRGISWGSIWGNHVFAKYADMKIRAN